MRRPLLFIALGFVLLLPQAASATVLPGEVIVRTNADRLAEGLTPLSENGLLNKAAQLKADDMVARGYYAHVAPDGKSPLYWLGVVGYRYMNAGENLDVNATSAKSADTAWMHSAEHRANILRPEFSEIGIGVADGEYEGHPSTYVVQFFGTPYPAPVKMPVPKPPTLPKPKAPTPLVPFTTTAPPLATTTTSITVEVQKALAPILAPHTATTTAATTTPISVPAATSTPAVSATTTATSSPTHTFIPLTNPSPVVTIHASQPEEEYTPTNKKPGFSESIQSIITWFRERPPFKR